ncbi:MAG: DMT family transporter, partial [Candidatus Eisenbacteria bacterium]|nr:DMT family transporter [Candidatus Eisenbacteria bacterium]
FALNLFRVGFSLPLLFLTCVIAGVDPFRHAPAQDFAYLIASGVIGIALSDTLFHKSLNLIGAGVTAIVDTFYAPVTVLLAFLLLGERVGVRDIAGMLLIMAAILLSATLTPPRGQTRAQLIEGIAIGIAGLVLLAIGIVIVKPVLNRSPVFWVALVRQAAGVVFLLGAALASRDRARILSVFRPSRVWRHTVPGTVLGSYLSLVFWIAGMKYTMASVAAILNQSSTIFILLFAILLLGERATRRKIAAAILAFAGLLLVSLP